MGQVLVERVLVGGALSPARAKARQSTSSAKGEGLRGRTVTVNLAESPLSWLKSREMIDARQFEAGERLRGDYECASLGQSVTMRWDDSPTAKGRRGAPDGFDPTVSQLSAKRRFHEALGRVGPGLNDVLWRVVCAGEGLPTAEKALGWPARAGRVVLTLALDRLADAYGLR